MFDFSYIVSNARFKIVTYLAQSLDTHALHLSYICVYLHRLIDNRFEILDHTLPTCSSVVLVKSFCEMYLNYKLTCQPCKIVIL